MVENGKGQSGPVGGARGGGVWSGAEWGVILLYEGCFTLTLFLSQNVKQKFYPDVL